MRVRRLATYFVYPLGGVFILLIASYSLISLKAEGFLFYHYDNVPSYEAGVVLGTSPLLRSGRENPFFHNRIQAAASLYLEGKIEKVLLSGDFSPPYYNEPENMKTAIMEKGVPEEALVIDPQGYRTYNSVLRANRTYGLDSFLVISQAFHAERAVFLARRYDIPAYAFIADDPQEYSPWYSPAYLREYFARVRGMWDGYVAPPDIEYDI